MSDLHHQRVSGRHPVNIGHLVMSLAFLGIVGVWALVQTDTVTGDDIRWLMPIPWVVAGLVGLVASAITGQRRYAVRQTGWVGAPFEEPEQAAPLDEETAPLTDQPLSDQPLSDQSDAQETP